MTTKGGEQFSWDALVSLVVHPVKVTIIEAFRWIEVPLSASDLTKIIDDERLSLSHVSYHVVGLANVGAIKKVGQRQVRGSVEKFYFFP